MAAYATSLSVSVLSASAPFGTLHAGEQTFDCALGRSGISWLKREGDGATPAGRFRFVKVFYRADRIRCPLSGLAVQALRPWYGWCDAPRDRNYNRLVALPYPVSAETLWRGDHLYDLIVVLTHNQRPRVGGLGSAIFLHVKSGSGRPTEGCVALDLSDLLRVVRLLSPATELIIPRS